MRFVNQPNDNTPRAQMREALKRMILVRGMKIGDKLPTYRELAQQFDVALLTVQRVMRDLADEGLIYRLHAKGAFLKRLPQSDGRLSQIGLLYPASMTHLIEAPYLNEFLAGLVSHCDHSQIDLQVLSIRKTMLKIPAREVASRVDGIVLLGVLNEEYIAEFAAEGVPLVLADSRTTQAPIHCLTVDNAGAVQQVMDHLYSLGHRRIAYFDTQNPDFVAVPGTGRLIDSVDSSERREAYLASMARLDLAPYQRIFQVFDIRDKGSFEDAIDQLQEDAQQPTAILTYDSHQAGILYQHLCRLNIRVPCDMTLAAAVGARGDAFVGNQALTFAQGDFRSMGWQAVEALLQQASGQQPTQPVIQRIGTTLAIGTTCGRPRGS